MTIPEVPVLLYPLVEHSAAELATLARFDMPARKLTWEEAGDAVAAMYGHWAEDDPEWWRDMVEAVVENGPAWLDRS